MRKDKTMKRKYGDLIIGLIMVAVMKQNRIPFGPAISMAFVMTLFIGTPVINWYLSLFF